MEWQPIATAPKNDTEILAYWPQLEVDAEGMVTPKVVGHTMAVTYWNCGWVEPDYLDALGPASGDDCVYADEPTHWMPLPEAPNDKAQGEAQGSSRLSPGAAGSAAGGNGD